MGVPFNTFMWLRDQRLPLTWVRDCVYDEDKALVSHTDIQPATSPMTTMQRWPSACRCRIANTVSAAPRMTPTNTRCGSLTRHPAPGQPASWRSCRTNAPTTISALPTPWSRGHPRLINFAEHRRGGRSETERNPALVSVCAPQRPVWCWRVVTGCSIAYV